MKHSKGPYVVGNWENSLGHHEYVIWSDWPMRQLIATVEPNVPKPEQKANADLFSAAPEMLEALEEFLLCGPYAGQNMNLLNQIEAVVNKAKGLTNT